MIKKTLVSLGFLALGALGGMYATYDPVTAAAEPPATVCNTDGTVTTSSGTPVTSTSGQSSQSSSSSSSQATSSSSSSGLVTVREIVRDVTVSDNEVHVLSHLLNENSILSDNSVEVLNGSLNGASVDVVDGVVTTVTSTLGL